MLEFDDDKIKENRNKLKIIRINSVNNNSYSSNIEEEDMKGITKRKDGRYVIRKTFNHKTVVKYARTIKEAQKIYIQLKRLSQKGEEKKIYTLKSWSNEWMEKFKKPFVAERTYNDIIIVINNILKGYGNSKLSNITTEKIQNYLNKLKKSRTKEKIQVYFNAILQKAEDLELIHKNPFKGVIKEKKGKYKNRSFTYDEQYKILNIIKNTEIEKEIYIYLLTGCRPNELPASKNFDFNNNIITINGTKNENAKERYIEMSKEFANYIKPYIENNIRPKQSVIIKQFKKLCEIAGIEKPMLYKLRHTFATNHFTIGTNAKQVQEWLGHYSSSLTLDVYTDIDKTSSKEKIKKLYNNFYYQND